MAISLPKVVLSSPIRFDIPVIRNFIEDVLDTMAQETVVDFQQTTRTWTTHKPVFLIEKRPYFRRVYTSDSIYGYVNFGTSVRHAIMSKGFIPKTSEGVIGSVAGAGQMVRVSMKINRPGITARRFDMAIQKRAQQQILSRFGKGLIAAVRKRI